MNQQGRYVNIFSYKMFESSRLSQNQVLSTFLPKIQRHDVWFYEIALKTTKVAHLFSMRTILHFIFNAKVARLAKDATVFVGEGN